MITDTPITWPSSDFSRIPFAIYHDRALYELEQERIFRGPTWNYLALEAELPKPGDFLTTRVGDTPVLVNRAQNGTIHAFINRCMHRGAELRREPCGNALLHTCVYHQWNYTLEGNLRGVPFASGVNGVGGLPPDFKKSDIKLRALKVSIYKGVIFGTFDDSGETLHDYLGPAVRGELDRLFAKPIRVLGYQRQRIGGNWKLYNDNVRDPNHGGLLHMFHATFGLYRLSQIGGARMDERHRHNISYNQLGSDDVQAQSEGYSGTSKVFQPDYQLKDMRMLANRKEYPDDVTLVILSVFPNCVFQQIANSLCARQIRSHGVDEMELYWTYFGYEDDDESMSAHRLRQSNLCGPGGYISMEDGEAVEIVHRATLRQLDAHARVEIGGKGVISDSPNLVTEVPIRGFYSYYHELMGFDSLPAESGA
jgi:anthranilate 1,2-dioxygenase large subunit